MLTAIKRDGGFFTRLENSEIIAQSMTLRILSFTHRCNGRAADRIFWFLYCFDYFSSLSLIESLHHVSHVCWNVSLVISRVMSKAKPLGMQQEPGETRRGWN